VDLDVVVLWILNDGLNEVLVGVRAASIQAKGQDHAAVLAGRRLVDVGRGSPIEPFEGNLPADCPLPMVETDGGEAAAVRVAIGHHLGAGEGGDARRAATVRKDDAHLDQEGQYHSKNNQRSLHLSKHSFQLENN
jgi:hypothetical protein